MVIQGVHKMMAVKNHKIAREIFRAYDIRGIVTETLTPEAVQVIGQAIGTKALAAGEQSVVIGRDGRLSGPVLEEALQAGILSTGCDVTNLGLIPTPVLYFATHHLNTSSGVMITGSHNPPQYNGLKIVMQGKALYGDKILALYELIEKSAFSVGLGKKKSVNLTEAYIEAIRKDICLPHALKIAVDCGNGAAGELAPQLYQSLGCRVIPLFCDIDGRFPNHHPDPGQPKNLQALIRAVQQHKADLGLAFDGDGDRLGVVDDQGKIIWPDRQLILFAKEIIKNNPKAKIIFDVKCTRHIANTVEKLGGIPLMWKTGHSLIKAKMQEIGALLAGEMSGHLFFKDRWFGFDDGLYGGARILEIISKARQCKAASEVFASLPDSVSTPELMIQATEHSKFEGMRKLIAIARFEGAIVSTLDGLRVDFIDGFGLVRPSNTGPNLILRFEGDTPSVLERIQEEFRTLLQAVEPKWVLPF